MHNLQKKILSDIDQIIQSSADRKVILNKISNLLFEHFEHYDWVGFYLAENKILKLITYVGNPTEHIKIPFGKGICGQVAESNQTQIVDDVQTESNYLSCHISVRSEIVIPIKKNGKFLAQLDIDSHQRNAFSEEDQLFLEAVCTRLVNLFP